MFDWPKGEFVLYGLKSRVKAARLLAKKSAGLKVKQTPGELRIAVPATPPDKDVTVIALEIDGAAQVEPGLRQQPDGKVTLSPAFADAGKAAFNVDARGVTTGWLKPEGSLKWKFQLARPGTYEVVLITSENRGRGGDSWEGGHVVKVAAGGQQVSGTVTDGGRIKNERNPRWKDVRSPLGTLKLARAGEVELTLTPEKIAAANKMGLTLRAVQLTPR